MTTLRNGVDDSLHFLEGFSRYAGNFQILADERGTRFIFQISEHDMKDLLGLGEARWEEAMVIKRPEILAACRRAYAERAKSWHANITIRLEKKHFAG
jgi:hypothetical protein